MELPSVTEAASLIRTGALSASRLLECCLENVHRHNGDLNAFVFLDSEKAREQAVRVDEFVQLGRFSELGPLAGIPFGVKDLEDCVGMPTTKGSKWFNAQPVKTSDSIHVQRLRAAGAIPIGKTATPEFGAWADRRMAGNC